MQASMASKLLSPLYIVSLVVVFFFSKSLADVTSSDELLPVDSVCNTTFYPSYCKSVLSDTGKRRIHDYSRSSVSQSLMSAMKFSALIDMYLADRSSLSDSAIQALEDCQLLMGLNIDFLQTCNSTVQSMHTLPEKKIGELQSMLSALLTNQRTCIDGIQAASVEDGLSDHLSNETKLYSVSQAIFTRGWGKRKMNLRKRKVEGRWGNWRKLLPKKNRKLIESASRRKLLQESDIVIVRDIVIVNPDGSENFTSINDAIAAAPNKTDIADGYFMIYAVSGVYEEYVNIEKCWGPLRKLTAQDHEFASKTKLLELINVKNADKINDTRFLTWFDNCVYIHGKEK